MAAFSLFLRREAASFIVAMLASVAFFVPAAMAATANPAEAFIVQSVDKGYAILNNASLSRDQRRAGFREFVLSLADMNRIGLFTLGAYANRASAADLKAFENAFTEYAVAVYESRLSRYKGQVLHVTGLIRRAPDDIVVNADLIDPRDPNGAHYAVGFRVRKTPDGQPIVTDMEIEGVWLALSERADFTGFLEQHGGSIAALTNNLRAQTSQIRAEAAPE